MRSSLRQSAMCRSTHSAKSIDGSIERSRSDTTALAVQVFIQGERFDLVVEVCFGCFALLLERREIVPQCGERVFLGVEFCGVTFRERPFFRTAFQRAQVVSHSLLVVDQLVDVILLAG